LAVKIGVAKISNSHRGFRFPIAENDIKNGQPGDPCGCAAARALKRHFDAKAVYVFRNVTYIVRKDGSALRYHTSSALRLETIVFDRNGEFSPGEYDLEPAPLAETKPARKGAASSRSNKRKAVRRVIPNVRPMASQRLDKV